MPSRTHPSEADSSSDPVTATYDVFLTPSPTSQILLLQYPNRPRGRPYNRRHGSAPIELRLKPSTGHLELDVPLNTSHNFNKYQGLKWGDAMNTAREVHNPNGTYGPAAGFSSAKPRSRIGAGSAIKDVEERENGVANDLMAFEEAEKAGRILNHQTLGGQIIRHDNNNSASASGGGGGGEPLYFVGAFRNGTQLHLTAVSGTVQMRPQFHHIDAEDQRARLAGSSRASSLLNPNPSSSSQDPPPQSRALLQREKTSSSSTDKETLEKSMRDLMRSAEEEAWVKLEYVDEDEDLAYAKFGKRMFVGETAGVVPRLKSVWGEEEYLDAISAPRRESPTRRRKRAARRREMVEAERAEEEAEAG